MKPHLLPFLALSGLGLLDHGLFAQSLTPPSDPFRAQVWTAPPSVFSDPNRGATSREWGTLDHWARQALDPLGGSPSARTFRFPPLLPALGARLTADDARSVDPLWREELADYVHEPFASQLGTLVAQGSLPDAWKQQLEAYRASREEELTALRAVLESADAEGRLPRSEELRQLQQRQTPRLRQLAAEAERLRELLTKGDWSGRGVDIETQPRSPIRDARPENRAVEEFVAARNASYYVSGYSLDQRELLRDMARQRALASAEKSAAGDTVGFLPLGSQFRLPPELPIAVQSELEQLAQRRKQIERALWEELRAHDRPWIPARRAERLGQLADGQTEHFAALEQSAESIRRQLIELPYFHRQITATSPTPASAGAEDPRPADWALYRDYYYATLLPGLSREQRRLLFNSAASRIMAHAQRLAND